MSMVAVQTFGRNLKMVQSRLVKMESGVSIRESMKKLKMYSASMVFIAFVFAMMLMSSASADELDLGIGYNHSRLNISYNGWNERQTYDGGYIYAAITSNGSEFMVKGVLDGYRNEAQFRVSRSVQDVIIGVSVAGHTLKDDIYIGGYGYGLHADYKPFNGVRAGWSYQYVEFDTDLYAIETQADLVSFSVGVEY